MTALTLYEVALEHRQLADKLAEMDIDETTLADTLEGSAYPVEQKARAVAAVIGNLDAEADAYTEHAKRVQAIAKSRKARADWLRSYLQSNMQLAGISEIKGPAFTIRLRDNPESVEVFEPGLVPQQFMRQPEPPPPAPDKAAIKSAIKAGEEVAGCRLSRSKRIEIK